MSENESTRSVQPQKLEPLAIFGFDGQIPFGLKVHPDMKHILFPLGHKIGINTADDSDNHHEFLSGHTNSISCLDVSSNGKFVASGQISYMGFKALIILWSWEEKKEIARFDLHKARVQALCFTAFDNFLVSLGGEDDDAIIVYDLETRSAICRSIASKQNSGFAYTLHKLNKTSTHFITCGDRHLRVWSIDKEQRKLSVSDVAMGKHQRKFMSMHVDDEDEFLYLGTMTGDLVKIRLNCCDLKNVTKENMKAFLIGCYGRHNPKKRKGKDCERYMNGIRDVLFVNRNQFFIGSGDGLVELVEERNVDFRNYKEPTWPGLKSIRKIQVNGAVSSLAKLRQYTFLIGTENSEIYVLTLPSFDLKLVKTSHKQTVYDVAFPKDFSLVFATASYESIRLWSLVKMQELLRIIVHNFSAASIKFSHDGKSIVSAWNDGVLRAFTPVTGKLIYAITNAHNKGCSAVTISSTGKVLVSGGIEGQVRVWQIETTCQSLTGVLKEHCAPVTSLDFNKFDNEVVSASTDGTCVIWDVNRLARKHVLRAQTQFTCATYFPTGVQILTSGSDRRITYWEVYDGSCVRELESSTEYGVNSVSINKSGEYFISVGNDQLVKLWDYKRGEVVCIGEGHAASVISCKFSPCGKYFVTGGNDGTVIIWSVPKEFWPSDSDPFTQSSKKVSNTKRDVTRKKFIPEKNENVNEINVKKSNSLLCIECPPIDCKCRIGEGDNSSVISTERKSC